MVYPITINIERGLKMTSFINDINRIKPLPSQIISMEVIYESTSK